MDVRLLAVDFEREVRLDLQDVGKAHFGRLAVLAVRDGDAAARLDEGVERRVLSVELQDRHGRKRAREEFLLAVDRDHESEAGTAVVLLELDARIQKCVGYGEVAEVEEVDLLLIDVDGEEVQQVDRGDLQDAQRGDCIGRLQFCWDGLDADDALRMAHGDAVFGHGESFRYERGESRSL